MSQVVSFVLAGVCGMGLGSAAGAADLPSRKAEPVDYVRTCSLGAFTGFVIPGSDVCYKLGGFVRYQYTWNQVQHGFRYVPGLGGYNSVPGRTLANGNGQRADAAIIFDARTETDYGLLRSYADLRVRQQSPALGGATSIIVDKAYIQFGQWSFGVFQSFFDFYTDDFNNIGALASDADIPGVAYTAKLGDSLFATFALEDRGNLNTVNAVPIPDVEAVWAAAGAQQAVSTTTFNLISPNAGYRVPDAVLQLLYDPGSTGWGKAQLSGAVHQARTSYGAPPYPGNDIGDTKYGWAVQGGVKLNLPMIAPGDTAFIQAAYAEGAFNYLQASSNPNGLGTNQVSNSVFLSDAVSVGPAARVKLSSGWNALVAFDHYWTPSFDTAVWASYTSIEMPGGPLSGTVLPAGFAYGSASAADFRYWQIGGQATWVPVKGLKFAGTLNYVAFERSSAAQDYLLGAGGSVVSVAKKDSGSLAGAIRIQRDF